MQPDSVDQRTSHVAVQAEQWAKNLIDLGPRNTLLHFANTKNKSLDLTECEPDRLDQLFTGSALSLRTLFGDADLFRDARHRARGIHQAMRALREEQGLEAGKLACGLVRTQPPSATGSTASQALRSPLLLRSLSVRPKAARAGDFELQVSETGEINRVLLFALAQQYGVRVDVEAFSDTVDELLAEIDDRAEQMDRGYQEVRRVAQEQQVELELEPSLVLGLFKYEKLPMANDLRAASTLLAEHDVVAAMAGVPAAKEKLRGSAAEYVQPASDAIDPGDEFLVQDADSSQQRVIQAALDGQHAIVEGPPGTGKSQTIANIIAGAAARGKSVLFVAEKRAAIEAVNERLDSVGLGKLVLDMHRVIGMKRHVAAQLADSLDTATREPRPDVTELHRTLADRRIRLRNHSEELHDPRAPWNISAYQVQQQLLEFRDEPAPSGTVRGAALTALDAAAAPEMRNQLADFVDAGGLRLLRHESPWSRSPIRNEQDMHAAAEELDELVSTTLQRSRRGMRRVIGQASLPEPRDLDGWHRTLQLLDDVRQTVQRFGPDIFGEQLNALYYVTAPARERSADQHKLPWRQRRSLVKQLRGMCDNAITKKKELHAALVTVVEQRQRWREIGGPEARPAQVVELDAVLTDYAELRRRLAAVALSAKLQNPEQQPTEQMEHTLDELSGDRAMLLNLPRLHELLDMFAAAGLSDLVDSIAERDADAAQAQRMFQHMWLRCLADEFGLRSRALREFSADAQDRVAEEFRTADSEHVRTGASRVRRRVDIEARRACDEYPREKEVLRTEANKKARHLPMSKLVEQAGHVLLALRPCWAMSPLVVSRTLPATRMFDLVVFDEASQILPHDAVTSIMRGNRLVVAGDDRQLPPTDFFDTALRDGEDQEERGTDLADFESILSTVRPLLPTSYRLTWHYRSRDERLIEFSNNEVYDRELVTFPNRESASPVRAECVEGVASPGQGGSSEAEVQRVVKLVLEHAERRPRESLGVIVWGNRHQQRIELAMRRAMQDRPDLADFFSSDVDVNRRFFVKNLETVQGDERDAIILSIGVARQANGTVNRQGFGILNQEVGVRRVNVAVTRAKRRMTVVSSFPSSALEPSDRESGTELLRRYLEFAERGGDLTTVGRSVPVESNVFERDIAAKLIAKGIDVHPQWGVSGYRIDFALAHPDRPGQMVLAVEADGDRYHQASSTRDRDRLRQEHLERLGWRFHRVWASAWFAAPDAEAEKIVQAWKRAVVDVDSEPEPDPEPEPQVRAEAPTSRRVARPPVPPGLKTQEYADDQLVALCAWLISDDLQLDREERVDQALRELGFRRRGARIVERLRRAVQIAQQRADDREV